MGAGPPAREHEFGPLEEFLDLLWLRTLEMLRAVASQGRIARPKPSAAVLAVDTATQKMNADAQRTAAHRASLVKRHGRWHE